MAPPRRRPPPSAPSPGGSLLRFALTGARAALAPPLRPHQLSPPKPTPAPPPPPWPSGPSRAARVTASLLPCSLSVYFQRRKRREPAKMAAGGEVAVPPSPQRTPPAAPRSEGRWRLLLPPGCAEARPRAPAAEGSSCRGYRVQQGMEHPRANYTMALSASSVLHPVSP